MKSGSFFRLSYTGNWARITCSRARMESHDAILPKPTASRAVNQRQIEIHSKGFRIGAGRGSRTPKTRRSADFESNPFIFQTTHFLCFAKTCGEPRVRLVRSCKGLLRADGQGLGRQIRKTRCTYQAQDVDSDLPCHSTPRRIFSKVIQTFVDLLWHHFE